MPDWRKTALMAEDNQQNVVNTMDTIDGMRTFVTVVNAGSFTAAAERLDLSQALVSKYVGQLEARLGVRLLNRTTRRLSLTEVGRAYHERCMQLLESFDELEAAVQERHSTPRGHLRISAPLTFGELYLTPLISEFLQREPGISVDLQLNDRFVDLLDEGVDVAIRMGKLEDSQLVARRLGRSRLVLCAAENYLARAGTPEHPRDLADHVCILDSNLRSFPHWPFHAAGEDFTVRVSGRFTVNSAQAARKMALAGQGVALCPDYVVGDDLGQGRLRALLGEFQAPAPGIYALYPHSRYLAAKVRAFVDFLVGRFAEQADWLERGSEASASPN